LALVHNCGYVICNDNAVNAELPSNPRKQPTPRRGRTIGAPTNTT
jgi:hypothetical protein